LKKILKDAKKCELSWIDDNLSRNDAFHSILNDGEITQVIKLFRVLHFKKSKLSDNGKHLHKADEKIYKECAKLLSSELSSILKTDNSDILSLVVED
ncbi:MAG: hypothetical protein IKB73_05130, partial [Ruminococcus sp.]|nr:hypothetical protein [Ruminococcus sp.]